MYDNFNVPFVFDNNLVVAIDWTFLVSPAGHHFIALFERP